MNIAASEPLKIIEIGDRVLCQFPRSLKEANYTGVIVSAGYSADQWRVQPDGKETTEIIHAVFIHELSEAA